jgi:exodeoxyribonuclease-3
MQIYSWNVNGLRAVSRNVGLPWDVLDRADVITLQEVKAQPQVLERGMAEPDGWYAHWHAAEKPGYSSVGVICRDQPDEVKVGIGDARFDVEGRVLAVRFGTLVVVSAYFPNSQEKGARLAYKLAFCAQMEKYLQAWADQRCDVVLQGDYNIAHRPIDIARPKENEKNAGYLPEERAWMDHFLGDRAAGGLGYRDVFRERHPDLAGAYTWWTARGGARARNVGWRIDYSTVNPGLVARVQKVQHYPEITGSDHCPVSITVT